VTYLSSTSWEGIVRQYRDFLSVTENTPILSLKEGNTPLIRAANITGDTLKGLEVYFKFDGANPTGSFKDRGMAMAISKALEEGTQAVICASTGNTSASAAAYAARAGIKCIVLIPEGKIAYGKLAQALIHGAHVLQLAGNFDQALSIVKSIVSKYPVTLVNSINPYRIEGQKTAAFEVCDELGEAPPYHALPVGNAGNITAYWRGYKQYKEAGKIKNLPRMLEKPETVATAIRIGNPASWKGAEAARDESGGTIDSVTDEEILYAYRLIASREGIFCEPASAASLAGVIKLYNKGYLKSGDKIVCTLTGHGLKDPNTAVEVVKEPLKIRPDLAEVEKIVKDIL
jgi:threonine synthase